MRRRVRWQEVQSWVGGSGWGGERRRRQGPKRTREWGRREVGEVRESQRGLRKVKRESVGVRVAKERGEGEGERRS